MNSHPLWIIYYLAVVVWISLGTFANAQPTPSHNLNLTFLQTDLEGGGATYGLRTFHSILFAEDENRKLIAPDGTEFTPEANEIHRNTFAEITTLAFGEWTAAALVDGVNVSFQFRVMPFTLDSVFTDVPIIISPVPGSHVPPHFTVRWMYENGSMPSRRGASLRPSPNVELIDTQLLDDEYALEIAIRLRQPGPGSITIQVNTGSTLPDPQEITRPPATQRLSLSAVFRSQSAPATYNIVPEPNALAHLIVASLFVRCLRRAPSE